jgi:hypothetical protein
VYTEVPEHEAVLFETRDPVQITDFLNRITFAPSLMGFSCACYGDMVFEFYDGDKRIRSLALHHGVTVTIENHSYGDYDLTAKSITSLANWLNARDIQKKLDEFTEKQQIALYQITSQTD